MGGFADVPNRHTLRVADIVFEFKWTSLRGALRYVGGTVGPFKKSKMCKSAD